ncbi:MAG: hypothetical protein EPO68_00565 [Planctomycetota bacterium]|nr:MAG: hypothetical protein EPO68_00565 [Planctomycetota bacterium]
MTPILGFCSCAAVLVAAALVIALALRPALTHVLVDVCGSEARARFWAQYSVVMVPLATFLGLLFAGPLSVAEATSFALPETTAMLRAGLCGMLIALSLEALVLMRGIAAFERRSETSWRLAQPPRMPAQESPRG